MDAANSHEIIGRDGMCFVALISSNGIEQKQRMYCRQSHVFRSITLQITDLISKNYDGLRPNFGTYDALTLNWCSNGRIWMSPKKRRRIFVRIGLMLTEKAMNEIEIIGEPVGAAIITFRTL